MLRRRRRRLSNSEGGGGGEAYLRWLRECVRTRSGANIVAAEILAEKPELLRGLVGAYLVVALAKCGAVNDAVRISRITSRRSVFSWTAILSAYVETGSWREALHAYSCMLRDGVQPDSHTFVSLFKACGHIGDLSLARALHEDARCRGLASVVFVANTLVSMYGKCGAVSEAEDVFSAIAAPTVVSWNAMLSVLVEQGHGQKALRLYQQMQKEGVHANELTVMIGIQACSILVEQQSKEQALVSGVTLIKQVALDIGRTLHGEALKKCCMSDVLVCTTLVSMYGKCGTLVEAENVFVSIIGPNTTSFTAMISAYVENNECVRALLLYRQMCIEGIVPNQVTFMVAIQACAVLAEACPNHMDGLSTRKIALEVGHALRLDLSLAGFGDDDNINSTLLSMYGKCGALLDAEALFFSLSSRNIVSCTAMLSAYVDEGQGMKAIKLYMQMQEESAGVDVVILKCVLRACAVTGNLELCKRLHFDIVSAEHEKLPSVNVTLIHAYGSCATMLDTQEIFHACVEPSIMSWNACITGDACEVNYALSYHIFCQLNLEGLEPDAVTFAGLLSACSYIGNVSQGLGFFKLMVDFHGIRPDITHYGSIVDLLGRAGDFTRVASMLKRIHWKVDINVWLSVLNACRIHRNLEFGKDAFDKAVALEPDGGIAYVLMSNIYAT